jgi:hypothetical protein
MALVKYARVCAKNTGGASFIAVAEKASITAITVTSGEISAITGTTPFKEIDAEQDSIKWDEVIEKVGNSNVKVSETVEFGIAKPSKTNATLVQSLIDGSPCGFFAIVTDGNAQNWLVGYNAVDLMNRPLRLSASNRSTGQSPSDEAGQNIKPVLMSDGGGIAIPFDSTLNNAINAGTSTIIDWNP